MPSFTGSSTNLVEDGPLVAVHIAPSRALVEAVKATDPSFPDPERFSAIAMVDTGAACTVVNPTVIEALKLNPIGEVAIHTPSTTTPLICEQFHVDVVLPNGVTFPDAVVICAPLGMQNVQCLIGRDILQGGVLTYIGFMNQFTLSF